MKTMLILGCLLFAAVFMACLTQAKPSTLRKWGRAVKRQAGLACMVQVNALGDGIHGMGVVTKKADAAHTYRYLLVRAGSDADHVALNGAAQCPSGLCTDTPAAAEDDVAVQRLGAGKGTVLMVASEALAAETDVFTAANGQIQNTPTTTGTFWLVGRTVTAAGAANEQVEVEPCIPLRVAVIANNADIAALRTATTGAPTLVLTLA